jgi:metallo-beta-lactamase family protein
LRHHLGRSQSSVIFVGYAAHGTLARKIIDGARTVSIHGERLSVRARIYTISGFSAHADRTDLLAWHARSNAKTTFLVHGDPEVMSAFAKRLEDTRVEMPELHEAFEL